MAVVPEQLAEIVDPVLVQEMVQAEMSTSNHRNEDNARLRMNTEECFISIFEIGLACSAKLLENGWTRVMLWHRCVRSERSTLCSISM
ncbi:hypothetical protein Pyn_09924 [Prunus yedoensis var. nudiflora]|uniref:Uncharacterized protein n=1 Tax=Prunus yedoensis var. nudiflora TaxID=2094558 RepID=A0A314XUJ9_PRUYE|nr:hypothetical protein Pyn_09924 [Prunus yedoensis var. nudiflora]